MFMFYLKYIADKISYKPSNSTLVYVPVWNMFLSSWFIFLPNQGGGIPKCIKVSVNTVHFK